MLIKRKSKIHGYGIFTKSLIRRGKNFYKIPNNKILYNPKKNCARIGKNKYVYDSKILNYINHSCNPNIKLSLKKKFLIALRNIYPEEEITCNYEKTELKLNKRKCKCKSKNCKGYFYKGE
jgi:SET domain-containing protein